MVIKTAPVGKKGEFLTERYEEGDTYDDKNGRTPHKAYKSTVM